MYTNTIELFSLPREDWYDEEGRIYKDAIIENLNAIEAKLNQLNQLDAFSAEMPDISTLSLEDVTLASDNNKIVNLKSFLSIFGLTNYPMELEFSGKKVKKFSYWNSSYQYITLKNKSTSLTKTNKYLFYTFSTSSFSVDSTVSGLSSNKILLGVYLNGRVINLTTPYSAKLNMLYLLSNMKTGSESINIGNQFQYFFGSGQQACIGRSESGGYGKVGNMTFLEEGKQK